MSSDVSSDVVLSVRDLAKCYQIYERPRHRLMQSIFRRRKYYREFWALRGVSLDVKRGEVLGIIGRNGAGKSTLLQAICGTATATAGTISVKGRVAALLELGAGFNPEFTGRENAFLNAAILGMTRDEIEARFDDIVAFSELEAFIDEPVKTYSSGMFVRLAFAVAIHVSPEILIVDEALSVGDLAFRNKCIEKIQSLVAAGVTVLFVTHDISTLQLLCSRVLWLDHGQVKAEGDPIRVSQDYYADMLGHKAEGVAPQLPMPVQQETGKAVFTDAHVVGGRNGEFEPGETLEIAFRLSAKQDLGPIVFNISIYRTDGDWVVGQTSRDMGIYWPAAAAGETRAGSVRLAPLSLAPGEYRVALGACSDDYSLCYALTDLTMRFAVRAPYPTWGKFIHPIAWIPHDGP
jgi:ABC-type polysaccharide/polyol phosphate transport system ATPase subunit